MLTKKQLSILSRFKLFQELTFKQIKGKSKSNNIIQLAIKEFQKEKLIKTNRIGNVKTFSLNLENFQAIAYLNLINSGRLKKTAIPLEILQNMQESLIKITPFFILIVFGSYAINKQNEKSDLDIALIVENVELGKELTPYLETAKLRSLIEIDYHVITKNDFIEMLKADYENLGKQILEKNIVYFGYELYIALIKCIQDYSFKELKMRLQ